MDSDLIDRMARLRGIGDAYHDYRGDLRHFSTETKAGLLRAMGCQVDDPAALARELAALENAKWRNLVPPVIVTRGPRVSVEVNVSARDFGAALSWSIDLDHAGHHHGVVSTADCPETWRGEVAGSWLTRRRFELPLDLEPGYHTLELKLAGAPAEHAMVIVSPQHCYEPPAIVAGARQWGVAVQLYTMRSRQNWGIGDFEDLKQLIRWVAPSGAGFVGLNPLHALAPADPRRSSPYSASSRHFLNVMYIAVPAVAEFGECAAARERFAEADFTTRLQEMRAAAHVEYEGVASLKFEMLEILYHHFREQHLDRATERGRSFRAFVAAGGSLLLMHARFDALDRHFCRSLDTPSGWMNWPDEYRDVNGRAAQRYAAENPSDVEFFAYLQWLAHEQLLGAQALTRELGMTVGLYGDYAVGANPSGAETWFDQSSYRMQAEIGAPPDALALKGQGWGIPPQDPFIMQTQKLQTFVRLIRNNMRYYGALRIDHVMSLFRLWWVAAGSSPTQGAYVHYPLEQLLGVLALESERNRCLVVGEDLGVVPDEMRRAMPEFSIYHYKVLLFEKIGSRFRRPDEFEKRALATVTTHDLPTLRSYWGGLDIDLRHGLDLYPSPEIEAEVRGERARDREILLDALREQGLAPVHPANGFDGFTPDLVQALHLYLARSTTTLVALQIEDLLGMTEPVNIPGTHHEYPNWQRKLTADIEDMAARDDLKAYFTQIDATRREVRG
jgi:4-alpha-glucanotransferase